MLVGPGPGLREPEPIAQSSPRDPHEHSEAGDAPDQKLRQHAAAAGIEVGVEGNLPCADGEENYDEDPERTERHAPEPVNLRRGENSRNV
jgi:hypothetical protein